MKLPFGHIPQPPISLGAGRGSGRSPWWGMGIVLVGVVLVLTSLLVSNAANLSISEAQLVEAVTSGAVQRSATDGNVLTRANQPPGKCPT